MTVMPWWGDLILTVAALLIAWGTIYRYIAPAMKGLTRFIQGLARLVEDWRYTGGLTGLAHALRDLAVEVAHVRQLAERADHELHPNKSMSLRDSVDRTERGIARLEQRVAAVTDQAAAISERQEILRAADEAAAADIRRFLHDDYMTTKEANAALRASVSELLQMGDEP